MSDITAAPATTTSSFKLPGLGEIGTMLKRGDIARAIGAMDGASKFVRGDAIAGLLVVFINVIGGMIIGIAQQGLSFADAAHSYTCLLYTSPSPRDRQKSRMPSSA